MLLKVSWVSMKRVAMKLSMSRSEGLVTHCWHSVLPSRLQRAWTREPQLPRAREVVDAASWRLLCDLRTTVEVVKVRTRRWAEFVDKWKKLCLKWREPTRAARAGERESSCYRWRFPRRDPSGQQSMSMNLPVLTSKTDSRPVSWCWCIMRVEYCDTRRMGSITK